MFHAEYRNHPAFWLGVKDMLKVAPGIAAWGLMTGVAMSKSGMELWQALSMTFFVFAGSAQLATTPLLVAGAPVWVIWATAACVNLRFVVFSAHLRAYLMHMPLKRRLLLGYITGDLSYILFIQKFPQPATNEAERAEQVAFFCGHCTCNWCTWILFSVLGSLLAAVVPTEWGLGFAGILALMGVACSLLTDRLRVLSAVVAGCAAVAAFTLPLKLNILVAIAAAVVACLAVQRAARTAVAA